MAWGTGRLGKEPKQCIDCAYFSFWNGEYDDELQEPSRFDIFINGWLIANYQYLRCHLGYLPYLTTVINDNYRIYSGLSAEQECKKKCSQYILSLKCPTKCQEIHKLHWRKYKQNRQPLAVATEARNTRNFWMTFAIIFITLVGTVISIAILIIE